MSFPDAVRTCFTKYIDFTGRARRSEYWFFTLLCVLVNVVARLIDTALSMNVVAGLASLVLLLPGLAVAARRLHDTGRSGWWQLLVLVPLVGWVVLLVWYVSDSKPGANQHGPAPKPLAAQYT